MYVNRSANSIKSVFCPILEEWQTTAFSGAAPKAMGGLKEAMYTAYILKSKIGEHYYIGYTNNIKNRLQKHNSGSNKSTSYYRPWVLVYTENFLDKKSAWLREHQIKSYKGGEAFKRLLNNWRSGRVV